jgi:hypothetical protein
VRKLKSFFCIARRLALFSPITIAGFLLVPSSSMAIVELGSENVHRNCAQLQRSLNDRSNPNVEYKGFEKKVMGRRQVTIAGRYIVFCNGGIVIDKTDGTICNGYIGYSYSYVERRGEYYGDWGRSYGTGNFNDTDQGKYCRWIDRPR